MQGEEFAKYLDGDLSPRLSARSGSAARGLLLVLACAVATTSFAAPTNTETTSRKAPEPERGTALGCVSSYDETVSLWTALPGSQFSAGKGPTPQSAGHARIDASWSHFQPPSAGRSVRAKNCLDKSLALNDVDHYSSKGGELFSLTFPHFPNGMR